MGWKLGLALALLVVNCYAETPTESTTATQANEAEVEVKGTSDSASNLSNTRPTPTSNQQLRVTPTIGSMLPPNPDMIVNLAPSEVDTAVKEGEQNRAELDHLKKSNKFRSAALGAPTKLNEVDIQNIDGANPHLPPFAFSGDDTDAKAKSIREIKQPDEFPPSSTPATAMSTSFEQARLIDSLEEIHNEGVIQEEQNRDRPTQKNGPGAPGAEPATRVFESVDTVVESDTTTAAPPVTAEAEVLDPIAEYNKKILELAKRRRMIKEQGYKKYKQIMFKSGRNIVPVRLFFDTDAKLPPLQPDDSFKRSITPPTETTKAFKPEGDKKNIVDASVVKQEKQEVHKVEISKQKLQPEKKKAHLVDSALFTTGAVDIVETTTLLTDDHILLSGHTESASEDVAGSGMPPSTTSESATEVQEEFLSHQTHHAAELVARGRQGAAFVPSTVLTFPEDITRIEEKVEVQKTRTGSTSIATKQPFKLTTQVEEESTTEKSIVEITSEILDSLGESTTAILPTATSQPLKSSVTIPVPPEPVSGTASTANLSQTLPPLLSMPPLSALSSFSSLNTPVKIATRPRQPKKAPEDKPGDERKKSFGIIGSKKSLSTMKPRRKLTKDRTTGAPFDVVDSEGRSAIKLSGTRPVSNIERHLFIKQKPSRTALFSKSERFGILRKGTRVGRPTGSRNRSVLVGQTTSPAVITRTHPGQQIFQRTFKIDKPKRNRIRAKFQRRNLNVPPIRQGGSATDVRSDFETSKEKSSVPLAITSPTPPHSPPVLNRLSAQPHAFNRQPTFGPSHQQSPVVQLSLVREKPSGVSMARGQQRALPSTLTRTLAPPLKPAGELNVVKPQKDNFSTLSEWDRIRAEFLRIKRQQKKLRQKQRRARARAASGVKTLSAERLKTAPSRERLRSFPHNGEIARGVVWREVEASKDPGAVRVDVDPSRHTIDRDAIVKL